MKLQSYEISSTWSSKQRVNPPDAETRIFQENKLGTMHADALAPWITKTSADTVLTMQDKQVVIFKQDVIFKQVYGLQKHVPSQC